VDFYRTGDELFEVMRGLERAMGVRSFFVMDENFLLNQRRALRLLELMRREERPWALMVFSSAQVLNRYTAEQLVGLGLSWVWMGLEGEDSGYEKLRGVDTRTLVRNLQGHGIRVLGSSIVGLPSHDPQSVGRAVEYAVGHATDFHQFMLYTPVPGTPLWQRHHAEGRLLPESECPDADAHGQLRFNYRHPSIPAGAETEMLRHAFRRDFEVNGPSVIRLARTLLRGWRAHRDHPEPRVRERLRHECRQLGTAYPGGLWAAERWFGAGTDQGRAMRALRQELEAEFGWKARLSTRLLGPVALAAMYREQNRIDTGEPVEPPTFYEVNRPAAAAAEPAWGRARLARAVAPPCVEAEQTVAAMTALENPLGTLVGEGA
jgi:hypothetical protein